jgi:hypothetical protein
MVVAGIGVVSAVVGNGLAVVRAVYTTAAYGPAVMGLS